MLVLLLGFPCIGKIVQANDLEEACTTTLLIGPVTPKIKMINVFEKGNINSPGFDKNNTYPNNLLCFYHLQAPKGMHVRLKFNALDIEISKNCGEQFLSIYDFDSQGKIYLVKTHCGGTLSLDYVSESHIVRVILQTGEFVGGRGFNITYSLQSDKNLCEEGEMQCRNRKCVDKVTLCDGEDNCGDGTDEEKCSKPVVTEECGKPEIEHNIFADYDRIVGGNEVIYGSWPWMADLQASSIEPNGHVCGGTLINSQWVVSAAHCFEDENTILRKPSGWRIHLGKHRKYLKDDYEQIRYVERIIIYNDIPPEIFEENEQYDFDHEIALIKLNAPVKFTKFVKPACLPEGLDKPDIRSLCYNIGWGATRGTGGSDVLKQAYHPIQNDSVCTRLKDNFKPESMICAGSLKPLLGVCHGDSGGPLLCKIDQKWTVMGVASFVTDGNTEVGLCGLRDRPTVFNNVAVKVEYIKRMIDKYS